jgi:hypothetical protein
MAIKKISELTAGIVPVSADLFVADQSNSTVQITASQLRQYIGAGLSFGFQGSAVGYNVDTYLGGSNITIPVAGAWRQNTIYECVFDMTKTAAGTAAFVITVRMGTLGTTSDAAIVAFTFGAGTAAVDSGQFLVSLLFKSVGTGTSAVLGGIATCHHHLAATGLVSTGASGFGLVPNASAGFNSTTQTVIGISVNGGASFVGTNTFVRSFGLNI